MMVDTRIKCLCGEHMAKISVMANVKSTTLVQFLCFHCGASTIAKEQSKRIQEYIGVHYEVYSMKYKFSYLRQVCVLGKGIIK